MANSKNSFGDPLRVSQRTVRLRDLFTVALPALESLPAFLHVKETRVRRWIEGANTEALEQLMNKAEHFFSTPDVQRKTGTRIVGADVDFDGESRTPDAPPVGLGKICEWGELLDSVRDARTWQEGLGAKIVRNLLDCLDAIWQVLNEYVPAHGPSYRQTRSKSNTRIREYSGRSPPKRKSVSPRSLTRDTACLRSRPPKMPLNSKSNLCTILLRYEAGEGVSQ